MEEMKFSLAVLCLHLFVIVHSLEDIKSLCKLDPSPPGVKSTEPIGQNIFRVGESVTIHCLDRNWIGRTRTYFKTIRCKENGVWESEIHCEKILCNNPTIRNGNLEWFARASHEPGKTLTYICNSGFEPKGRQTITCNMEGNWDNLQPCEPYLIESLCKLGPSPSGVKATEPIGQNVFRVGESVTIHCLDRNWIGMTKTYFKTIRCKENGVWESAIRCEKILCNNPRIQNANLEWTSRDSHEPGKTLAYTCNSGFEPKDIQTITCNMDGNWDNLQPCERENTEICDPPPYTENAVIISKDKQKATYKCRHNFKMMGNSEISCTKLQWEDPPQCTTSCHLPPYIENAVISSHINFQSATYKCRDQFIMIGRPTITCVDYEWGKPPECVDISALERP